MVRTTTLFAILAAITAAIVLGALALSTVFPDPLRHDTPRWAVIEDVNGDRIAVETPDDAVWAELLSLHANGTEQWVGGPLERYGNAWGFRFVPANLTVAEVTAEGLQTTLREIRADPDYWLGVGIAYVGARVVEVHEPASLL
jgi:hypothetical protein